MKRLLCLFLLAFLMIPLFAACKNGGNGQQGTTPTSSADGNASDSTEPSTDTDVPEVPKKNWNDLPTEKYNTEVNILGRKNGAWSSNDLWVEDSSTTLSAAVISRNTAVELRHGITLNVTMREDKGTRALLEAMDKAEVCDYDLYSLPLRSWGTGLVDGFFLDLQSMNELDLSDSWWDQSFVADLTIYGQLYGILSDATYVDEMSTWAVAFNKDMISAHNLNVDMYQLVDDKEWTFAKMTELAKAVSLDVNEDGEMVLGGQDIYGVGGELANLDFLIQASGMPYAYYRDEQITYSLEDQRNSFDGVFRQVFDLVADSTLTYMANVHPEKWKGGRNFFEQQQMLFYIGGINNLPTYFRAFKHDYGVVPMPKYTAEQDRYYNAVTTSNCPTLCISKKVRNPAMSAVVLQALACRGESDLTPVFYETILKKQSTRDPQSWKMLDLIFKNRIFDLATIHNFGNLAGSATSYISELVKNGKRDEFVSTVETYSGAATKMIEKLMAFYDENYKPE